MTGYEHANYEAFDSMKETLVGEGHFVMSPADLGRLWGMEEDGSFPGPMEYGLAIVRDLDMVLHSDAIFMLAGWEGSTGARLEHAFAVATHKTIMYESE